MSFSLQVWQCSIRMSWSTAGKKRKSLDTDKGRTCCCIPLFDHCCTRSGHLRIKGGDLSRWSNTKQHSEYKLWQDSIVDIQAITLQKRALPCFVDDIRNSFAVWCHSYIWGLNLICNFFLIAYWKVVVDRGCCHAHEVGKRGRRTTPWILVCKK